jgi:hypothetical protein
MSDQKPSRRELLKLAGAVPFATLAGGLPPALIAATDGPHQISGYKR